MPPLIPLSNSDKGLSTNTEKFGNLFQGLHLQKIDTLSCFNFHCPSVHFKDKKGKTKLEKRTCNYCKLYQSTIEANQIHQRKCKAEINQDVKEEETDGEEEDDEPEQNEQEEDEPEQPPIAEKGNHDDILWTELICLKGLMSFILKLIKFLEIFLKKGGGDNYFLMSD